MTFAGSDLGFDAAGAHDAPARYGFKNGEQARHHENQSQPQRIIHEDDTRYEAECPDDAAGHAAAMTDIRLKETTHAVQSSTWRA